MSRRNQRASHKSDVLPTSLAMFMALGLAIGGGTGVQVGLGIWAAFAVWVFIAD